MFENISEFAVFANFIPADLVNAGAGHTGGKCMASSPVHGYNNSSIAAPVTVLSVLERRLAGSSLLLLCSVLQSLYYLTFFVLCKWRLWYRHTFFLWLISLSVSNCSNLIMYSFGFALTILKFPNCVTTWNIWAGHIYNFFFAVSYAHFPAMAFIRLLAVWKPTHTQDWCSLRRTVAMISGLWLSNAVHVFVLLQFRENWFYFNPVTIGWDANDAVGFGRFFTWYWLVYEVICVGMSLPSYSICYMKIRVMQQERATKFGRTGLTATTNRLNFSQQNLNMNNNNNNNNNNNCTAMLEPCHQQQHLQQPPPRQHHHHHQAQSPQAPRIDPPASARKAERLRTAEKNLLLIGFALSAIMGVDIVLWRTSILIFNGTKYAALMVTMVEIVMYGVDAVIILTLSKEVRTKVRKLWSSTSYSATTSL